MQAPGMPANCSLTLRAAAKSARACGAGAVLVAPQPLNAPSSCMKRQGLSRPNAQAPRLAEEMTAPGARHKFVDPAQVGRPRSHYMTQERVPMAFERAEPSKRRGRTPFPGVENDHVDQGPG